MHESAMAECRQRLERTLEPLAELLREHGEEHWAAWIDTDRARISEGDAYGVTHLLAAFGGMGSLNDLRLHPVDGHRVGEDDAEGVHQRLAGMLETVYRDAAALQRALESPR